MANKRHYTAKQIEIAIRESRGFLSVAAERLGCTYQTVSNYIKRYKTLQEVLDSINERELDLTENKLLSQIKEGNTTAIIFYLKCKGKKRGYVEKSEVEHTGEISVTNFLNSLPPTIARAARELLAEELVRRRAGKKVE